MTLLRVEQLKVDFDLNAGALTAVNGVSFELGEGETLGVVGESGSGKTVTALSIMGLLQSPASVKGGKIWYKGQDLTALSEAGWGKIRGRTISMIFQEPMTSLNPVLKVGIQIAEIYVHHLGISMKEGLHKAAEMLEKVKLPDPHGILNKYPYELSGGMRQRVMIAVALACRPDILIADEPTTALDVTVQSQILKLILEVQAEMNLGLIFISHNLSVVAQLCNRVAVMYAGEIVEEGFTKEIFSSPRHPYTAGLIDSIPRRGKPLKSISGSICDLASPPSGCRFHPRCPFTKQVCREAAPSINTDGNTRAACHYPIPNTKGDMLG
ncbi:MULTISPECIES: ABC transporter ATP-binding protein [unclassified Paenibacillus]|uniref:ABC transporter ATP-binding protein n=1 Tax=unclassified Paenibacillus TaxID=185978 RepID=UPI001AE20AFA|nr:MULTISPECIES: ABC transporter ATP-binding protein [unclassified Paenibacillus]MBP1156461.1 oligopeptide/dipeptide ABC transporter ATP-binding protein [Paenibacillus sp. PvP091]MBP1168153.1 oligopeptide/dipeptide ABC transporter ATP-binding protein [Paenibacillus sp. PvR098]MBP2439181.1 oligopeptide/dipeptide ABC transporter ATP-binding protein [Paenibacillus sp. PvP052]